MDKSKLPAMKPVLVTDFVDDIRAVRRSDVSTQQTVLTTRAVKDIFAGDDILNTNESDTKYFNSDGLVDLNLIVDAGCRHLTEGTYTSGPEYAIRETDEGERIPLSGYLYTMAQLPNEVLLWGPVDDTHSPRSREEIYESIKDPETNGSVLPRYPKEGDTVRQLFYISADSLDDPRIYSRIGRYESFEDTGSGEYFDWVWGDWFDISGQKQYIVVTDALMKEVVRPITNAIYSVHTNISAFHLPDANDCKYGAQITIIQHPDTNTDDRDLWATNVEYEHGNPGDEDYEKMQITCTPSPRRNTEKADAAYLDGLQPSEYTFEVAPRMDEAGGTETIIGKTWHLKVNPDETEFTNGLAEIVDAHTELGVNDIIDYGKRKYYEEGASYPLHSYSTLVINRSVTCDGFVCGDVTKLDDVFDSNWTMIVKRLNSQNPITFKLTSDTQPVEGKTYYTKAAYDLNRTSAFQIAVLDEVVSGSGSIVHRFYSNTKYYEVDESVELEDIATITAKNLLTGVPARFKVRVFRNDIIYISIAPGSFRNGHISARSLITPVVKFLADPHPNTYLQKDLINPSAYTAVQMEHLKAEGVVLEDAKLEEQPVSSAALLGAYNYIASKLAAKGLLEGAVRADLIDIDWCKTEGIFWITTSDSIKFPQDIDSSINAHLVVFGSLTAPSNLINEEAQYKPTTDRVPLSGKEYFLWDSVNHKFVSVGTLDVFSRGIAYFDKIDEQSIKSEATVTQFLVQKTNMWVRYLNGSVWSSWVGLIKRNVDIFVAETSVDSTKTKTWFNMGNPNVYCGIKDPDASSYVQNITLPNPETLAYDATITFHFSGIYVNPVLVAKLNLRYVSSSGHLREYTKTYSGNDHTKTIDKIVLRASNDKWLVSESTETTF